jgi:hypothetical protein
MRVLVGPGREACGGVLRKSADGAAVRGLRMQTPPKPRREVRTVSETRWMECPECGDVASYKANVADHAPIICHGGHVGRPEHDGARRRHTDGPPAHLRALWGISERVEYDTE